MAQHLKLVEEKLIELIKSNTHSDLLDYLCKALAEVRKAQGLLE
jgi:hypothetical protein